MQLSVAEAVCRDRVRGRWPRPCVVIEAVTVCCVDYVCEAGFVDSARDAIKFLASRALNSLIRKGGQDLQGFAVGVI